MKTKTIILITFILICVYLPLLSNTLEIRTRTIILDGIEMQGNEIYSK